MQCHVCDGTNLEPLEVESFLFPPTSYAPEFHEYENYICAGCGVVSGQPEPTEERLVEHYNTAYRKSRDATQVGDVVIDTPIDMSVGGRSLKRVRNLYKIVSDNTADHPDLKLGPEDVVVDFGAYQGMFLYGVSQLWDCQCIAADYNRKGIEFAQKVFGFASSQVTADIYSDTFGLKISLATMVHSLEHLRDPVRFLEHLRKNILKPDGFLYVEVPNLYGIPLCEPTHFFTYSKDSLTYLMERCGFEVLDMFTSGFPETPEFTGHNDIQNLICLARPRSAQEPAKRPSVNVPEIRHQLQASYSRHSSASVRRQFGSAIREMVKSFYYLIFAIVLERVSPKLMTRVAILLGRRGSGTTDI
jgi:SAM-dependent methyltransferase